MIFHFWNLELNVGFTGDHIHLDMIFNVLFLY
jgi:hypothetical protein